MVSEMTPTEGASGVPIKAEKDSSNYDIYTYELPVDVPSGGVYQVVIRLCRDADGKENSKDVRVSARIYG